MKRKIKLFLSLFLLVSDKQKKSNGYIFWSERLGFDCYTQFPCSVLLRATPPGAKG